MAINVVRTGQQVQNIQPVRGAEVNQYDPSFALPMEAEVEAMQQGRKPITYGSIAERFQKGGLGNNIMGGLEMIGMPFQRVESAVTPSLMAMQEMARGESGFSAPSGVTPQDIQADPNIRTEMRNRRIQTLKDVAKESYQGLAGQKVMEIGDVPRRAGFGEAVSAYIGLGAAIAAVDPIIAKGVTTLGGKIGELGRAWTGMRSADDVLKPGIYRKVLDGLDDVINNDAPRLREGMGAFVGNSIRGLGDDISRVAQKTMDDVVRVLPKGVLDDLTIKALDLKVIRNQADDIIRIPATKENIWKLSRAIKDSLGKKNLMETASGLGKSFIKKQYKTVRGLLDDLPADVQSKMDDFGDFVSSVEKTQRKIKAVNGQIKEKGIRTLETTFADEGIRKAFAEFSKWVPKIKGIVAESANITSRARTGRNVARIGGGLVGLEAIRRTIKGGLSNMGGGNTTTSTSGGG